ncbi:MAG: hypothetical protein LBB74_04955 [Chitinispirillales bacterium]|jgi:gamma-glutamylcysteine synthetase|nr:hypothetical protein [Chitinispirillales bacterium]
MKPRKTLAALTALWVLLVFLEGASSLIRRWYTRKMGAAARAVSGIIGFGKLAAMVFLALSNVLLFLRHVGDDNRVSDNRADITNR